MSRIHYLLIIFIFELSISACTMAGLTVSGAQAVYNRHHIQKNLDDQYTSLKVYKAIYYDTDRFKRTHVSISAFNDSILVVGQVPNHFKKIEIKSLVNHLANDRSVYDFTEVANPSSFLTRASDGWITSKVKAKLIASKEVDPTQVKVVTENGTVYLLGRLEHQAAEVAVQIAQETTGVQSVVKLISYITISKA